MFFQPTNIFPDLKNGTSGGTVDIVNGMDVLWQVNGNSPMIKYKIEFYDNDPTSTFIGRVGPVTLSTPFSGTDFAGNKIPFVVNIPPSTFTSLGMTNGNEYKMYITQWYTQNDSITQSSASVFRTRQTPSISINTISVDRRDYTFNATFNGYGDLPNWIRWELTYEDNREDVIYDTHEIYGTSEYKMYYDGFVSGTSYSVRVSCETENGFYITSGWIDFTASYTTTDLVGSVDVSRKSLNSSAVKVSWSGFRYIHGNIENGIDYTISGGSLNIRNDSGRIYWDDVNGTSMSFTPPWNILYGGTLMASDAVLFSAKMSDGNYITAEYVLSERSIKIKRGSSVLYNATGIDYDSPVKILVTGNHVYIRGTNKTGGLYPSSTTRPNTNVYPKADDSALVVKKNSALSYTQRNITEIGISGKQTCEYIQVISGTVSQDIITEVYDNGTFIPDASMENTEFLADFENDLDAGTLYVGGDEITGWAVYRYNFEKNQMKHVVDLPMLETSFCDYSLPSGLYTYKYLVYPMGGETYITSPIESEEFKPCFRNWYILECDEMEDGTFNVINEFIFRNNLRVGDISNNNSPGILDNFTRYPTVQISTQNYLSGKLESLIGEVHEGQYIDNKKMRDDIYNLSTTNHSLILKGRKGDVIFIRPSGNITMTTLDGSPCDAQTASINWIQVGEAYGENIVELQ